MQNRACLLLIPIACAPVLLAGANPAVRCESLSSLSLPNVTITAAQSITGSFTPPGGQAIDGLPPLCRVAGVIRPAPDSNIQFEVWMPVSGWNGKFQGIGNGGFAGSISYGPGGLATAVTRGYAAASTDTGHQGSGVDATWALGHPDKIVDFGYRAIHEMTGKGKSIIKAFYGEAPRHSYFASCSNGGRQALMEAQRYPDDYDGIIAGAPAYFWTHTLAGFVWNAQAMSGPGSYIPAAKLKTIESGVLAACGSPDGQKDRTVNDPSSCHFDPAALLCQHEDSNACLTAPQIDALRKIYAGPSTAKGDRIIAGFEPGAETGGGGWGLWITGFSQGKSLQFAFATQFLENMVFNKSGWDYKAFDFDRDLKLVDEKMGPILNATNPDLKLFRDRGGKLILFHGWADAALPPLNTIRYLENVKAKMGEAAAGSFVRLYMIPGLQHCTGGPGANYCGGLTVPMSDAEHDLSAALERWVENGVAPGPITASKLKQDSDPASGVISSRTIQPYSRNR